MHYLHVKTRKIVKLVIRFELQRITLKFVAYNTRLPFWVRQYAVLALSTLSMQSSLVRLRNRCYFSGSPRWLIKHFKTSRMRFKVLVSEAVLTGVSKSSW